MLISTKPAFCFLITVILCLPLNADVIVTKENMILNGKIVEDKKPDYVKFTNKYGTFKIEYKQIKEIYITENADEDKKIIKELSKPVNDYELKKADNSAEKDEKKQKKDTSLSAKDPESCILMLDLFFLNNFGKLSGSLPESQGITASGEFPLNQPFLKNIHVRSIKSEIICFHSENGEKYIKGYNASAGPLLCFSTDYNNVSLIISGTVGVGKYSVKSYAEKKEGAKWHMTFSTGPEYKINSIILSPQLKFVYIYDSVAPLYGAGFTIGAGYKF